MLDTLLTQKTSRTNEGKADSRSKKMNAPRIVLGTIAVTMMIGLINGSSAQQLASNQEAEIEPQENNQETPPVPTERLELLRSLASIPNTEQEYRQAIEEAKGKITRAKEEFAQKMAELGQAHVTIQDAEEAAISVGSGSLQALAALQRCRDEIMKAEKLVDQYCVQPIDKLIKAIDDDFSTANEGLDLEEYQGRRSRALALRREYTSCVQRLQDARRRLEQLMLRFIMMRETAVVDAALGYLEGRLAILQEFVQLVEQTVTELEKLLSAPVRPGQAGGRADTSVTIPSKTTPVPTIPETMASSASKSRYTATTRATPKEVILVGTPVTPPRYYYGRR
jgi:chromosome segregation ATPase